MEVEQSIRTVWDYHHMNHELAPADAILVLGSHDTRVAERAVELYHQGLSKWLILSGGLGRLTEGIWQTSEADLFREIALKQGVPDHNILVENRSTNSGENFSFTEILLREHKLFDILHSFIVVQKPYMERRAYTTFKKHWPTKECRVTSPQSGFEQYCQSSHPEINREAVIHLMVGDLQRLWVYADQGFQVPVQVPDQVMQAYQTLVEAGYTQHLVHTF
ncbi:MAG: YdcF family protein [Tunicatimonas sp.]|uniref:YdcF family protein n=1 Tax=Tunicatimonas sp. TaxID=1940096 RepID=UPI003C71A463